MLRVKERMKVEFSRSITLSVLALFHRTGHALKTVLTNRYTCTPQRRPFFPLRGGPSSRPTSAAPERGVEPAPEGAPGPVLGQRRLTTPVADQRKGPGGMGMTPTPHRPYLFLPTDVLAHGVSSRPTTEAIR